MARASKLRDMFVRPGIDAGRAEENDHRAVLALVHVLHAIAVQTHMHASPASYAPTNVHPLDSCMLAIRINACVSVL